MMTADQLRTALFSAGIPPWVQVICTDETYGEPTVGWLRDKFWPWFQQQRFDLGLLKWERKNDCDNFSRAYAQAAADCHALTNGEDAEGLAVGEFLYIASSSVKGPHAIISAFTDEGLVYFEPQTGQRLALTPAEQLTAFSIRF